MALEEGLNRSVRDTDKDKMAEAAKDVVEMSKEEQIGFHKGSINTLIAERNELLKIIGVTEQLVNAHAAELSKLGVSMMPPSDNK